MKLSKKTLLGWSFWPRHNEDERASYTSHTAASHQRMNGHPNECIPQNIKTLHNLRISGRAEHHQTITTATQRVNLWFIQFTFDVDSFDVMNNFNSLPNWVKVKVLHISRAVTLLLEFNFNISLFVFHLNCFKININ